MILCIVSSGVARYPILVYDGFIVFSWILFIFYSSTFTLVNYLRNVNKNGIFFVVSCIDLGLLIVCTLAMMCIPELKYSDSNTIYEYYEANLISRLSMVWMYKFIFHPGKFSDEQVKPLHENDNSGKLSKNIKQDFYEQIGSMEDQRQWSKCQLTYSVCRTEYLELIIILSSRLFYVFYSYVFPNMIRFIGLMFGLNKTNNWKLYYITIFYIFFYFINMIVSVYTYTKSFNLNRKIYASIFTLVSESVIFHIVEI